MASAPQNREGPGNPERCLHRDLFPLQDLVIEEKTLQVPQAVRRQVVKVAVAHVLRVIDMNGDELSSWPFSSRMRHDADRPARGGDAGSNLLLTQDEHVEWETPRKLRV